MSDLISVVIPVYNRKDELQRTLDSLAVQTSKKFEVIVCDDGSEDPIESAVEKYKQYLDIRYIRLERSGGPARPRNTAVKCAKYEWISFLDSDDWWDADRISNVTKYINMYSKHDVFYHKLRVVGNGREKYGANPALLGRKIGADPFPYLMMRGNCIPNSAAIVRKKLINKVGGCDEGNLIIDDYDLWLKLAKNGANFKYIPIALGSYWQGSDGISITSPRQIERHNATFNKHYDLLSGRKKILAEILHQYLVAELNFGLGSKKEMYEFIKSFDLRYPSRFYLYALRKILGDKLSIKNKLWP